jgi:hypothetical protein
MESRTRIAPRCLLGFGTSIRATTTTFCRGPPRGVSSSTIEDSREGAIMSLLADLARSLRLLRSRHEAQSRGHSQGRIDAPCRGSRGSCQPVARQPRGAAGSKPQTVRTSETSRPETTSRRPGSPVGTSGLQRRVALPPIERDSETEFGAASPQNTETGLAAGFAPASRRKWGDR